MRVKINITPAGAKRLGIVAGPAMADVSHNDPRDEPVFFADDIDIDGCRVGCCLVGSRYDGTVPDGVGWTFADGQDDIVKALSLT